MCVILLARNRIYRLPTTCWYSYILFGVSINFDLNMKTRSPSPTSFHFRTPRCEHRLNNQPTMSDLLPAVLLNALRQYKFDGSPLWRMADGKDHVNIEVTFRKTTIQRFVKKGTESRRRPTPPANCLASPFQLDNHRRDRCNFAEKPTPCQEKKEATPPSTQAIPATTRNYIKHDRTQKAATIQPSPIIRKPPTPPSCPDSPPAKKTRTESPPPADDEPPKYFYYDHCKEPYPREV